MSWFLEDPPDFRRHNEEVAAVWKAYHEGRPRRVPVSVHGSIRNLIQNPALNTTGFTFEDLAYLGMYMSPLVLGHRRACLGGAMTDSQNIRSASYSRSAAGGFRAGSHPRRNGNALWWHIWLSVIAPPARGRW